MGSIVERHQRDCHGHFDALPRHDAQTDAAVRLGMLVDAWMILVALPRSPPLRSCCCGSLLGGTFSTHKRADRPCCGSIFSGFSGIRKFTS